MLYYLTYINTETGETSNRTPSPLPLDICRKLVKTFERMDEANGDLGKYKYIIESETISERQTRELLEIEIHKGEHSAAEYITRPKQQSFFRRHGDTILIISSGIGFGIFVLSLILGMI